MVSFTIRPMWTSWRILLLLMRIEPQFFGRPARSLVTQAATLQDFSQSVGSRRAVSRVVVAGSWPMFSCLPRPGLANRLSHEHARPLTSPPVPSVKNAWNCSSIPLLYAHVALNLYRYAKKLDARGNCNHSQGFNLVRSPKGRSETLK